MKIVYEPAECSPNCEVADCPYMHGESWIVYGSDKIFIQSFSSREEARAFIKAASITEGESHAASKS